MQKKEYLIYLEIFKLIETCRIINSKSKSITIERDAENNSILLDDIVKKFFTEKIYQKRVEKKIDHGYILGNLFILLNFFILNKNMHFFLSGKSLKTGIYGDLEG